MAFTLANSLVFGVSSVNFRIFSTRKSAEIINATTPWVWFVVIKLPMACIALYVASMSVTHLRNSISASVVLRQISSLVWAISVIVTFSRRLAMAICILLLPVFILQIFSIRIIKYFSNCWRPASCLIIFVKQRNIINWLGAVEFISGIKISRKSIFSNITLNTSSLRTDNLIMSITGNKLPIK